MSNTADLSCDLPDHYDATLENGVRFKCWGCFTTHDPECLRPRAGL
ncbi:MAG: hypothetical protein ISQ85_02140 [Planktomarina sp.]|nr:hypothetical protein [Planktomarina sp.]